MNIPLPEKDDIFALGFDRDLSRGIPDNATGVVYNSINETQNTASLLSGGNLNLKTLSIGGLVRQVAPGDDIQAAIDAVNREGGGIVQLLAKTYILTSDIELKSNVTLLGAGRDLTILNFNNRNFRVRMTGTSASVLQNISIQNLTIRSSASSAGLEIQFADFWFLENCKITTCTQIGVSIDQCTNFRLVNCLSSSNTGIGFSVTSGAGRSSENFILLNTVADSNGGDGYNFEPTSPGDIQKFSILNCSSVSNTGDGFDLNASNGSLLRDFTLLGCTADSNGAIGFNLNTTRCVVLSCRAISSGTDGFFIDGPSNTYIGNIVNVSLTGMDFNFNTSAERIVFMGNSWQMSSSVSPKSQLDIARANDFTESFGNGDSAATRKETLWMKNTSASNLAGGQVVVRDSSASDGESVTTTSINGDNRVYGALNGATINSGTYGPIQTIGYNAVVWVNNSAASIAVGDWLSTYSHAYYAKKAVAGDTVFAFALEAPTTGTARIEAILVTPRLI